jgi:hypothetical protein
LVGEHKTKGKHNSIKWGTILKQGRSPPLIVSERETHELNSIQLVLNPDRDKVQVRVDGQLDTHEGEGWGRRK